jgi:hypothetical protein
MKHHQPRSGDHRQQRRRLMALSTAAIAAITGNHAANAAPVVTDPFAHRASAASVSIGVVGDGKPDFQYNVSTGDIRFFSDGAVLTTTGGQPSFVQSLQLLSASGLYNVAAASPDFQNFTTPPPTSTNLSSAILTSPGFTDGYDIGMVLPAGLSTDVLTSDLTLKYQPFFGGALRLSDVIIVPESTAAGAFGLIGAAGAIEAMRARRRSRRVRQARD